MGEVERYIDSLIAKFRNPHGGAVHEEAAYALGETRSTRAVGPLLVVLARNPDPGVRETAASALGKIRDRQAVDGLIAALRDDHWSVREAAARALGGIRDPRAIDALVRLLEDYATNPSVERNWVAQAAAHALGDLADTRAISALQRIRDVTFLEARPLDEVTQAAIAKIQGGR